MKKNEKEKQKISIFGNGAIFNQVKGLLLTDNINIENVYDDDTERGEDIEKSSDKNLDLLFCVGYRDMEKRFERYKELKKTGHNMISYCSPNSIIFPECKIKRGTIINVGVILSDFSIIGECNYVNWGSIIGHGTVINDNVYIAPGVNIAGAVKVNSGVFIGIGATIIDNITIGKNSIIAAGSVVIEDVPPNTMVAGCPAKIKKELEKN